MNGQQRNHNGGQWQQQQQAHPQNQVVNPNQTAQQIAMSIMNQNAGSLTADGVAAVMHDRQRRRQNLEEKMRRRKEEMLQMEREYRQMAQEDALLSNGHIASAYLNPNLYNQRSIEGQPVVQNAPAMAVPGAVAYTAPSATVAPSRQNVHWSGQPHASGVRFTEQKIWMHPPNGGMMGQMRQVPVSTALGGFPQPPGQQAESSNRVPPMRAESSSLHAMLPQQPQRDPQSSTSTVAGPSNTNLTPLGQQLPASGQSFNLSASNPRAPAVVLDDGVIENIVQRAMAPHLQNSNELQTPGQRIVQPEQSQASSANVQPVGANWGPAEPQVRSTAAAASTSSSGLQSISNPAVHPRGMRVSQPAGLVHGSTISQIDRAMPHSSTTTTVEGGMSNHGLQSASGPRSAEINSTPTRPSGSSIPLSLKSVIQPAAAAASPSRASALAQALLLSMSHDKKVTSTPNPLKRKATTIPSDKSPLPLKKAALSRTESTSASATNVVRQEQEEVVPLIEDISPVDGVAASGSNGPNTDIQPSKTSLPPTRTSEMVNSGSVTAPAALNSVTAEDIDMAPLKEPVMETLQTSGSADQANEELPEPPLFLPSPTSSPAPTEKEVEDALVVRSPKVTPPPRPSNVTPSGRRQMDYVLVPLSPYRLKKSAVIENQASSSKASSSKASSSGGKVLRHSSTSNLKARKEDVEAQEEAIKLSRTCLREWRCRWEDCDALLDSSVKLQRHVKETHAELENESGNFACKWSGCWHTCETSKATEHLEEEHTGRFCCYHKDCDRDFPTFAELLQHLSYGHLDNDPVRPLATPFAPRLPLKLPELPETMPSYELVACKVRPKPMTQERHETLGSWVATQVSIRYNLPPRRLDSMKPSRDKKRDSRRPDEAINDQYDFLTPIRQPPALRLADLDSTYISQLVAEGLVVLAPEAPVLEPSAWDEAARQPSRPPSQSNASVHDWQDGAPDENDPLLLT